MRFLPAILTVCCLWGGASAPAGPASAPVAPRQLSAADRARAEKLIRQMGDESFRRREAAYKRLGEMGPAILPLLRKHRNHADAEIAARIESLMKLVGWTTRGALVVRMQVGTQAWPLGFRRGDVVVKIDDDDIVGSTELVAYDHSRPRTAYIWREGKIITKKLAPGKIGIYIRNWDHDAGGAAHARGLAAAVTGRYEQAYRLLLKAEKHWTDDPWTKYILVGLAEYNLDHKRAMGLYRELSGPVHRSLLAELGVSPTAVDADVRGLPFTSAHTAWLLDPLRTDGPIIGRLTLTYFLDAGRNYPLVRALADAGAIRGYPAMRIALHEGKWAEALKRYGTISHPEAHAAGEAVTAALQAGDVGWAARIAVILLKPHGSDAVWAHDAAHALAAAVAALATGQTETGEQLLLLASGSDPEKLVDVLVEDTSFLFCHMAVNRRMIRLYEQALIAQGRERPPAALRRTYLDLLRFDRTLTLQRWKRAVVRHIDRQKLGPRDHFHWQDASALLRFGRCDEARRAAKRCDVKAPGLRALNRAIALLSANAARLSKDWAALKGVTQLYDGRAKGSHWAVRYDGRTFYVDPSGKVREYPGLAPGQVHRGAWGDAVLAQPDGTIYNRRGQTYLLDEKAGRWVKTYAAPCRAFAFAYRPGDPTAPAVLRYVVKRYPAAGPGRELAFRAVGPGPWRIYQFNGDIAVAVRTDTLKLLDLGGAIARLAGRKQRVRVYRCWTKGPWPLIPTDAGLWTMAADGKLSRVTLDPKKPNVHVSILRWPKRPGKMHVGVAPQDGGQIYELDVKTRKVALTAGYCGVGPDDSYHWFMHDRAQARHVPAEYAIQALYEKHLAAKKK